MASLLGAAYDSSDDDATTPQTQVAPATPATKVIAAPEVNTEVWSLEPDSWSPLHQGDGTNNPTGSSAHADDAGQHHIQRPHVQRNI
jgi:hypothetical protein